MKYVLLSILVPLHPSYGVHSNIDFTHHHPNRPPQWGFIILAHDTIGFLKSTRIGHMSISLFSFCTLPCAFECIFATEDRRVLPLSCAGSRKEGSLCIVAAINLIIKIDTDQCNWYKCLTANNTVRVHQSLI